MSFDIALSGIQAINEQLSTISNNIANAGTYGFKSSRANFASLHAGAQHVIASGATARLELLHLLELRFGKRKVRFLNVRELLREQRIEMHLRSREYQIASIRRCDLIVDFVPNETICTEACHKFLPEQLCTMSHTSGFRLEAQWIDEQWPFAENLLVAV